MFDAVHVVVGAVRELNRSQEIGVKPLSCTSPQIWQHGTSLMNYLRMVRARANTHSRNITRVASCGWRQRPSACGDFAKFDGKINALHAFELQKSLS